MNPMMNKQQQQQNKSRKMVMIDKNVECHRICDVRCRSNIKRYWNDFSTNALDDLAAFYLCLENSNNAQQQQF